MVSFLWAVSRVPLVLVHGLGIILGLLVWIASSRFRRFSIENAQQAGYGGLRFWLSLAMHMGMGLLEIPFVWFNTQAALKKVTVHNWALIETCQNQGKGILFVTPHWGCFEIAARYYASVYPITVLFRAPKKSWLERVVASARQNSQLHAVPANLQGVKELLKTLKRGHAVGMLPDQVPGQGEGVWSPFFGRYAQTMTLSGRLASMNNVQVIIAGARRLSWGRGWELVFSSPVTPMPEGAVAQATWFNGLMEEVIRRAPEQYLWGYNRYKGELPSELGESR